MLYHLMAYHNKNFNPLINQCPFRHNWSYINQLQQLYFGANDARPYIDRYIILANLFLNVVI